MTFLLGPKDVVMLLLIYGGWPFATYVYLRFQRRQSAGAAARAALMAWAIAFFFDIAISDEFASMGDGHPNAQLSRLTPVLWMLWIIVPYALVCIWWILRLFGWRRESPKT